MKDFTKNSAMKIDVSKQGYGDVRVNAVGANILIQASSRRRTANENRRSRRARRIYGTRGMIKGGDPNRQILQSRRR
ncbi:hypothetical protein EVAR_68290_1 [Eumeta japonica]|uniref:Uncharacterized protein n=1 Tax=Eumeta variegata TaxID=151549 RepID=A0A4C1ZY89_EUMVA|nr:hypothetical protein EVAR_68290_1 [Eumeta japonica]